MAAQGQYQIEDELEVPRDVQLAELHRHGEWHVMWGRPMRKGLRQRASALLGVHNDTVSF